ncbi:glutathione S-transferase family protein [Parahaliea aestuarii]|uniref:Glutathione S-transferase n=1 Tax=Parahaliea aestuarii TaxID=1852021 RepID=A0A5C8ZRP5_9GAMM|nr:glutathione S-transferase [Parahaliea aestuarii]TXS90340.1 glutathione S-transferase [Parahaliea aestuarii]
MKQRITRTLASSLMMITGLLGAGSSHARDVSKALEMPEVTIYHLEGRRSERIVWLMEELNLPYKLVFERGDLGKSMANIREVNPDVPMAPTVTIGDQVLVESGAIIEVIINRYAPGQLQPPLESVEYANHMMWMHFAEGSLASRLIADYRVWMVNPPTERSRMVDSEATVQYAENYLAKHEWFGGDAFSTADIMMMFPLNFATALNIVDEAQFPKIAAWKKKAEARPAYQRMLKAARPDGLIGALPRLPQHLPSGSRQ